MSGPRSRHGGAGARFGLVLLAATVAAEGAQAEVRRIGGPAFTPPTLTPQAPERVEPPARPVPPPPAKVARRTIVAVEDAATLKAGPIDIVLADVAALGAQETCRDGAGVEWPCGRRMVMAMRSAIRLRPVECDLPKEMKRGRIVTRCRLDGADLAELVVRRGWARAGGAELAAAEDEARRERRGLHGAAQVPSPEALDLGAAPSGELPPDITTAPLLGGVDEAPTAPTPTAPAPRSAARPAAARPPASR